MSRVVVLAGGLSHEREVSLRSGRRVAAALRTVGVDTRLCDADAALLPALAAEPCDAVFIALHGGAGEDGSLRAVLDLAGVRYAGSGPAACRTAFDKPTAKAVVRGAGLHTPDWVALPHSTFRELGARAILDRVVARLGLPLMVKPAQGGSALGAAAVQRAEELPAAMMACFSYGDTALIERLIVGTEVAVTVLDVGDGPQVLPVVEIAPLDGVFDYAARYTAGATAYHTPARLPEEHANSVASAALRAHRALGLRGLSRTDLVVDGAGRPEFLEVNVAPGMTETSLLPMALQAAGLELGDVCRRLLTLAAQH